MNLLDFIKQFPDETSCRVRFKQIRDEQGVICKKCQGSEHYWLSPKGMYQCKKCRFRTSLRSGTVMENSKLSFQHWFIVLHLMSTTKKAFSALEIQRQLGFKRYQPIWEMMHKIRIIMGKRDDLYPPKNVVEMDEGFFETARNNGAPKEEKRGRGSERQATVLVMAESKQVVFQSKKKGHKPRQCGYFKMIVLENMKGETINREIKQHIEPNACVRTDGFRGYSKVADWVELHLATKANAKEQSKLFPWVHIAISNAKRTFLGIYHMMKPDYLQNYLNEFCYKLNRRYHGNQLFDRLLVAATVIWY